MGLKDFFNYLRTGGVYHVELNSDKPRYCKDCIHFQPDGERCHALSEKNLVTGKHTKNIKNAELMRIEGGCGHKGHLFVRKSKG
jgi:hypothetical protein